MAGFQLIQLSDCFYSPEFDQIIPFLKMWFATDSEGGNWPVGHPPRKLRKPREVVGALGIVEHFLRSKAFDVNY